MNWKTAYRSFYYTEAPEPEDLALPPAETALLCIDVQNYGLAPKPTSEEQARWAPFYQRMNETVIPNLRLVLANMGIRNVIVTGIYTDQCVSSTVRSLADQSFNVIVVEDCCAAGTLELHQRELEIINMIYCHVLTTAELRTIMGLD